jgi:hypothetical protein
VLLLLADEGLGGGGGVFEGGEALFELTESTGGGKASEIGAFRCEEGKRRTLLPTLPTPRSRSLEVVAAQ